MKTTLSFLALCLAISIFGCAHQQTTKPTPAAAEAAPAATSEAPTPAVVKTEVAHPLKAQAVLAEHLPKGRMPDSGLTPGKASYRTLDQICTKGSAKDERNVSEAEKKAVYEEYGIERCGGYCSGKQGCEIDHLISLEIGGANTEDNLWPQPYDGDWSAHDKDRLEGKLHQLICNKTISLEEAQTAISTDWVAAYREYIGDLKPFKATPRCPR
jgi:hypothetical protein